MRVTREELRAARDELRNKAALLDGACREASEAASSIERLTEESHGLRGDLQLMMSAPLPCLLLPLLTSDLLHVALLVYVFCFCFCFFFWQASNPEYM